MLSKAAAARVLNTPCHSPATSSSCSLCELGHGVRYAPLQSFVTMNRTGHATLSLMPLCSSSCVQLERASTFVLACPWLEHSTPTTTHCFIHYGGLAGFCSCRLLPCVCGDHVLVAAPEHQTWAARMPARADHVYEQVRSYLCEAYGVIRKYEERLGSLQGAMPKREFCITRTAWTVELPPCYSTTGIYR